MINVAIIGAGIGAEHLVGYRELPKRFRIKTVCDLDTPRAAKATQKDPDIAIVSDLNDVLNDPEVDLIDVCLPPHLHMSTVVKALDAGKHAICEKPIGRSLSEIDQMQDAMAQSKGQVFPVFQYRYGRATAQLAALRAAGLTGRPLVASAETHWNRGGDYYQVPWRGTWNGEAGGAILGHAIHAHDLLCHVMGPVAEVSAHLDTLVNDIEVDDCAAISMRMTNGALVTSSVTLGAATDTSRLRFCFADLTAESGSSPYSPADDTWTFTARGDTGQADVDRIVASVPAVPSRFTGFLDAVANALAGQNGGEVTFEDGRRSIELVTALYMSARDGRPVKLPIEREAALYDGWTPV